MNKKTLTLDDYQVAASHTAIYPYKGKNLVYTVMGLAGEAGELANKVKKLMRSAGLESNVHLKQVEENILKITDKKKREKLIDVYNSLEGELGGILWYVSQCATELYVEFNHVGTDNLDELSGRVKKDNVEGDGDDRGRG